MRTRRGFTLIEMMVVVAIIGILAALSVAAYNKIGSASAPRNAINDLTAQLMRARTLASDKQADVWVIIYPTFSKANASLTGGPGAYFIYVDRAGTFDRASGGTSGEVYYQASAGAVAFDPAAGTISGAGAEGKLLDKVYLEDYAGKNVLFDKPSGTVTLTEPPFSGMSVGSACSFCSSDRGAIVFGADGSARFIDGAGNAVAASGTTSVARSQVLALRNKDETRAYAVAVSAPTSFTGVYDLR